MKLSESMQGVRDDEHNLLMNFFLYQITTDYKRIVNKLVTITNYSPSDKNDVYTAFETALPNIDVSTAPY